MIGGSPKPNPRLTPTAAAAGVNARAPRRRRRTRLALAGGLALGLLATVAGHAHARAAGGATDVAQQAGIAQTTQSFDTLVLDYDQDGTSDFVFSPQNASTGRQLWHANGDGTYTLAGHLKGSTTSDQHGCTSADYDHNGQPDVFCSLGAIHGTRTKADPLWLQQANGSFTLDEKAGASDTPIDPLGRGYSASTLDANEDGWPDLFVDDFYPRTDGRPTPDRLYLNLGDDQSGTWLGFQDATGSGIEKEQGNRGCDFTTDLTHDGHQDIVFCGKQRAYFYEGDGNGHFTDVSAALGLPNFFAADLKLADINSDGVRDLVYVRGPQWGIRLGKPGGGYAATSVTTHALTAGRMLAVGDVTGDGIADIYVLQGNGAPGCTTCQKNYPDQLWLGDGTATGFVQEPIPEANSGSGDTVNLIGGRLLIGNGANLIAGPVQLIAVSP